MTSWGPSFVLCAKRMRRPQAAPGGVLQAIKHGPRRDAARRSWPGQTVVAEAGAMGRAENQQVAMEVKLNAGGKAGVFAL